MTVMEQDKLEEVNPARLPGLGTFPQGRSIQVFLSALSFGSYNYIILYIISFLIALGSECLTKNHSL